MNARQKPSNEQVQKLWRMVLAVASERSGLDLQYVLKLKPFVSGEPRDLLANQANGCKLLSIYLLRTQFNASLPQIAAVAGISHQRVKRVVDYVARDRDDNPTYEEWIASYERVLNAIGETAVAA